MKPFSTPEMNYGIRTAQIPIVCIGFSFLECGFLFLARMSGGVKPWWPSKRSVPNFSRGMIQIMGSGGRGSAIAWPGGNVGVKVILARVKFTSEEKWWLKRLSHKFTPEVNFGKTALDKRILSIFTGGRRNDNCIPDFYFVLVQQDGKGIVTLCCRTQGCGGEPDTVPAISICS